jgi:hypothetical protein
MWANGDIIVLHETSVLEIRADIFCVVYRVVVFVEQGNVEVKVSVCQEMKV